MATTIIQVCQEMGRRVPEDMAVIGVDNDEWICEFAPVPLSSIDANMEAVGYEAAVMLDKLMNGAAPPKEPLRISPQGVVLRQSTDTLAIPHPALVLAIRFIRDHFRGPIQTNDVVEVSGMSRRGLYNAFELYLKCTVAEEIMRLRLELAARLLRETRMKTFSVAAESGFSNYVRLNRVFTRHFGMSPSRYRRSFHRVDGRGD